MLVYHQSAGAKPTAKGWFMLNDELIGRWNHLKNNMQHLWMKFSEQDFEAARNKISHVFHKDQKESSPHQIHIDNYQYESHRIDDLPLTLNKDPGPGVKYAYTENSEFARDAEKVNAYGIDSFGEEDTFDPDEADEHQDFRNRNQNSDLSKRFYTSGMEDTDLH